MKIQWQEPVEYFQAYLRSTGTVPTKRGRILAGFIGAAVVVLLTLGFEWFFFWLHKKDLGVPLYWYFVAPPIAGVVVWIFPVMLMAVSATMILNEKGLYRNKAYGSELHVEHWPWDTISELAFDEVQYEGKAYRVLSVRTRLDEAEMLFGLGTAPLESIQEFAGQMMGKPVVNRLPGQGAR